jgi:hypothetical protein
LKGGTKLQVDVPLSFSDGVLSAKPTVVTSAFTITGYAAINILGQEIKLFETEPFEFGESNRYTSDVDIMEVPEPS